MDLEKQGAWGWPIATAVFLGGAGGGVFLISFIMDILGKYAPLARLGATAGPVLAIFCTLFLIIDLGSKASFYKIFSNLRSSWMSRGGLFIMTFAIFGLGYSLPSFWFPWGMDTSPGLVIGVIAAVFAFLVILYTGILFGVLRRIQLWNTPALPLLYIFCALSTGLAVLLLIDGFFVVTMGEAAIWAVPVDIALILMEIIVLGVYLEIVRKASTTGSESVRLLLSYVFVIGVVIAGLIIPLAIQVYIGTGNHSLLLSISSAILILIGGFLLRYSILKAGLYTPLYP